MKWFLLLVLFSQSVIAAPYYRFWRGYKRDHHVKAVVTDGKKTFVDDPEHKMSWEDFESLVNTWLIPATTSCCAEMSLIAYLPVMLPKGKKQSQIHDEIALIVYKSEEAYKATREDKNNIEAQVYGPLHADVFAIGNTKAEKLEDREKTSRSLVPIPFHGEVDLSPKEFNFFLPEAAYDILSKDVDWQKGHTVFRISLIAVDRESLEPLNTYLREMKGKADKIGLLGHTVLVTERYIIEYLNWEDSHAWSDFLKSRLDHSFKRLAEKGYLEVPARPKHQLDTNPLQYEKVGFLQAGNLQFEVGKKPAPPVKHPRLD